MGNILKIAHFQNHMKKSFLADLYGRTLKLLQEFWVNRNIYRIQMEALILQYPDINLINTLLGFVKQRITNYIFFFRIAHL